MTLGAAEAEVSWHVAADIGGTFTDVVLLSSTGDVRSRKILSTPHDYSRAILDAIDLTLSDAEKHRTALISHGTTVATNALLEGTASPPALVTTAGFADVLEIRRARRSDTYDLAWTPPRPLVPSTMRFEVVERMSADGTVVIPLDEESVAAAIDAVRECGAGAVAISLLHSYRAPDHERRVADAFREALPAVRLSASHRVAAAPKEYERTSTVAVNAMLLPVMRDYLDTLRGGLDAAQMHAPVRIMRSDATMATIEQAGEVPCAIIESAPAAGVLAAAALALELGLRSVITFDMGGTTAKAALIESGTIATAEELTVGASINQHSGLLRADGYTVRSPCVDLSEVGSGGGSIAWVDGGGVLRVGPRSAGAEPGPACYGLGGTEPTVTDAHVVLGYLNPASIAGGSRQIHPDRAAQSIQTLADTLGAPLLETARAIYDIATSTMRRAVRAVTVERGRAPSDSVLIAFGGGGGLHAATLADELDIDTVVVPPLSGLFSSLGLLFAELSVGVAESRVIPVDDALTRDLRPLLERLAQEAVDGLSEHGNGPGSCVLEYLAHIRYCGQSNALPVRITNLDDLLDTQSVRRLFEQEHQRAYGHISPMAPIELVSVRVQASRPREHPSFAEIAARLPLTSGAPEARRSAYFGTSRGTHDCAVLSRNDLGAEPRCGPLILDEPETTILIPPGFTVRLDDTGSLILRRAVDRGD